jgi:hypothetical protein
MKIGDKVICISNTTTGTPISPDRVKTYNVRAVNDVGASRPTIRLTGFSCYYYADEFALVDFTIPEMVESINEIRNRADIEIMILSNKISYMELTGSKKFNETEFKVFSTLQELKKSNDDLAKAKAIAKLINN